MRQNKTNFLITTLLPLAIMCSLFSCGEKEEKIATNLAAANLIPQPVSITVDSSAFRLKGNATIFVQGESEELLRIGQYFSDMIKSATGLNLSVKSTAEVPGKGNFHLVVLQERNVHGEEGYQLDIKEDLVTLYAGTPAGIFRGTQTIRQMLPINAAKKDGPVILPTGSIQDKPTYSYRGAMLDVSRHFFQVEDVKRYIDFLAEYKMNAFHIHLSDDQGWRIEIKKWPNLTAHGGKTQVGGGKGGFYTQEQYADIVKYAQDRYITVVPEIDMPGHTNAALASYPELNCNGKAPELYTGTEVGFSTLCSSKEITYQFIDDVITELAALTPGPFIHIGGDESHATKKEDYLPFVNRVKGIVEKHGKTMIGWDETAQADLNNQSVVQLWANEDFAKMAVAKGAQLIMSPAKKAYMDMQYDSTTKLGLHWAAYIEVDSAYLWDPATYMPGVGKDNVLGIEAPLWSETVTNLDEIEYMVFPRLLGYAEIGWTPVEKRNWEAYKVRLGKQAGRLRADGIDYYESKLVPWEEGAVKN
ncbi:MAG: beta-N-acetylhexosaminidase [Saprospiraceae bacterium]